MSSDRAAEAWSSGSTSDSSRRRGAVGAALPFGFLASFSAGGRRGVAALRGSSLQLGELALQLGVARPEGLEEPGPGVEGEEERGLAERGVGVVGAAAEGRLDGRVVEQPSTVEPDQGAPADVGVLRAQRDQVRLGRLRVVGRFQGDQGRQADLGRLRVEGGGEPGEGLVVLRGQGLERLDGQLADVGLLGLQGQVDRPEVDSPEMAPEAPEGRDPDGLVAVAEAAFEERRGPGMVRRRQDLGGHQAERVVGVGADLFGDQLDAPGVAEAGQAP